MLLLLISFLAGVLTVLAPCVLPLLPIIIGGSLGGRSRLRPLVVTGSLAISVILFTLLLRVATVFISVPLMFWNSLSGVIVLLLGVMFIFPNFWSKLAQISHMENLSQRFMNSGSNPKRGHLTQAAIMGASLGPVFTSCSPTYALILAITLPQSFAAGVGYITAYALGLALVMLLISFLGQTIILKLKWLANPNGNFKKVLGVIFLVVGISIITGLDKKLEAAAVNMGWYGAINLEESLIDKYNVFK